MNFKRIVSISASFIIGISAVCAQNLSDFNSCLESFSQSYIATLQNATLQQNIYAKAYIGKFLPSLPPHFAIGIDGGVTKLDGTPLNKAANMIGFGKLTDTLVVPTFSGSARIGGFFLPFDIGFSVFGYDSSKFKTIPKDLTLEWFSVGGDLRWAILEGKGLLPCISAGIGYYYTKGKVSAANTDTARITQETQMHTGFITVQISKTFIFITPYAGFKGIFTKGNSNVSWAASSGITGPGGPVTSGNFSVETDFFKSFIPQIYGGLGIAMGPVSFDLNGGWDFRNKIWTAGLAIRVQL